MPYTIVHCADVHLETTFASMGGARRRTALQDAFVRIVDHAIAIGADALTIGGDLFEAERSGPQTARFLIKQFSRFAGRVFIAPGNHDPYSAGALLAQHQLPDNTRLFNEPSWQAITLADGLTLFGFGHTPAEPGAPFAHARFDRPGVRLALVHGSDIERCPPKKRATAPFTVEEIARSGASFVLTGHYHGGYTIEHDGRPILAYPGSPEPIKFGENGEHGALIVRVDGTALTVERFATAQTRVIECMCSLEGCGDDFTARRSIEEALSGLGSLDFVKLTLTGNVEPGTRIDLAALQDEFSGPLGALEMSDETLCYDFERLATEPTVRGRVARDLLALAHDHGDPERAHIAQRAVRIAMAAFDGSEVAP